jgi:hypothetical protein
MSTRICAPSIRASFLSALAGVASFVEDRMRRLGACLSSHDGAVHGDQSAIHGCIHHSSVQLSLVSFDAIFEYDDFMRISWFCLFDMLCLPLVCGALTTKHTTSVGHCHHHHRYNLMVCLRIHHSRSPASHGPHHHVQVVAAPVPC